MKRILIINQPRDAIHIYRRKGKKKDNPTLIYPKLKNEFEYKLYLIHQIPILSSYRIINTLPHVGLYMSIMPNLDTESLKVGRNKAFVKMSVTRE